MKCVAVTGSTGLVGTALVASLRNNGHRVLRLRRTQTGLGKDDVYWDPKKGDIDKGKLAGVDAVVNLAGENIAGRRWSRGQKALLRGSRIDGTGLMAETIAGLAHRPAVFLSASAIGFYGNRDEEVDESSEAGTGFLPELCRDWEKAASGAGTRVVHLRIGVVLSPQGGALGRMLLPFKMCVGGPIGSGRQPFPWISLDDTVGAIEFLLENKALSGPVNLTSPGCVSNGEFAKALGRVLGRPAFLPLPAFVVRAVFGELGDAILLGGAPVVAKKLQDAGYPFLHRDLEPALRHVLKLP